MRTNGVTLWICQGTSTRWHDVILVYPQDVHMVNINALPKRHALDASMFTDGLSYLRGVLVCFILMLCVPCLVLHPLIPLCVHAIY